MATDIVIVTLNQHDVLRACLTSVRKAMAHADAGEMLVVDNASVDATPAVLAGEFPEVRVIRNDVNLFYTLAANQGARATKSEFIFLLNDDTTVSPDTVRALTKFMRTHPKCGAVGPAFHTAAGELTVSAQRHPTVLREISTFTGVAWRLRARPWASRLVSQYQGLTQSSQVDWVCGGAILLRRALLEELGLLDEAYLFYRDDPDIGRRIRDAGWEVWYCTDTRITHHHGMSTARLASKVDFDVISIRSRRHFHRKFHGLLGATIVECADAAASMFLCVATFVRGRRSAAAKHLRHVAALARAFRRPIEERLARDAHPNVQFSGADSRRSRD